jgi:hypothetical protein
VSEEVSAEFDPAIVREMARRLREHANWSGPVCPLAPQTIVDAAEALDAYAKLLVAARRCLPYLADLVGQSGLEAGFGDRLAYDALEEALTQSTGD